MLAKYLMRNSFYRIIVATVALLPLQAMAQGLKAKGSRAVDIVPSGWESIFKTGDLNHDGIVDLVLIATTCDEENMKTRDDGYVYNFNQPLLAIYWGEKNGDFTLFKQYNNAIPARPNEFMSITPALDITANGTLKIELDHFASAGSWEHPTTTYLFRYQKGDFFLIGKDESVVTRNTGKTTVTSENYLTHKRIVTTTSKRRKKTTIRRTSLPKTALKSLGFNLDD